MSDSREDYYISLIYIVCSIKAGEKVESTIETVMLAGKVAVMISSILIAEGLDSLVLTIKGL